MKYVSPRTPRTIQEGPRISRDKAAGPGLLPFTRRPAEVLPLGSEQTPRKVLGSFAVSCRLPPCRVRTPPDWVSGFAPFLFSLPTRQDPEPALLRIQAAMLNLSFSNSENPGIINPRDVGAHLVYSFPRATPSLTHGDGTFHAAELMVSLLYARLSVYQSMGGVVGEGRNGEK